jgi:hypothetical protein
MGVYAEVQEFVLAHRPCARPRHGGAGPPTVNRYRLIVVCGCGAEFKRWDKVGRSERNRPALSLRMVDQAGGEEDGGGSCKADGGWTMISRTAGSRPVRIRFLFTNPSAPLTKAMRRYVSSV